MLIEYAAGLGVARSVELALGVAATMEQTVGRRPLPVMLALGVFASFAKHKENGHLTPISLLDFFSDTMTWNGELRWLVRLTGVRPSARIGRGGGG